MDGPWWLHVVSSEPDAFQRDDRGCGHVLRHGHRQQLHFGRGHDFRRRERDAGDAFGFEHGTVLRRRDDSVVYSIRCWRDVLVDRPWWLHVIAAKPDAREYDDGSRGHVLRDHHRNRLHVGRGNDIRCRERDAGNAFGFEHGTVLRRRDDSVVYSICCRRDVFVDWSWWLHVVPSESGARKRDDS